MLNPQQLAQLKAIIEERRQALATELQEDAERSRAESYGSLAGPVGDAADSASADLIADVDNAELTRDLTEFRALEAAQERLAAGTYGTCIDCGKAIGFERLLAQPAALRCIDCQTLYEKTHAQTARPTL